MALKQLNKTFYYLKKKKKSNKLLQTDIVKSRNVFKAILISSEVLSMYQFWFFVFSFNLSYTVCRWSPL